MQKIWWSIAGFFLAIALVSGVWYLIRISQDQSANDVPINTDSDGDGLTDQEEREIYKTNELLKDSDQDGLTDFDEVRIYNTNPLNKDSDGDGFTDEEEIRTKHDPLKPAGQ